MLVAVRIGRRHDSILERRALRRVCNVFFCLGDSISSTTPVVNEEQYVEATKTTR